MKYDFLTFAILNVNKIDGLNITPFLLYLHYKRTDSIRTQMVSDISHNRWFLLYLFPFRKSHNQLIYSYKKSLFKKVTTVFIHLDYWSIQCIHEPILSTRNHLQNSFFRNKLPAHSLIFSAWIYAWRYQTLFAEQRLSHFAEILLELTADWVKSTYRRGVTMECNALDKLPGQSCQLPEASLA